MIYQLIYSSSATIEFWPDDLFTLVESARRKNALRGITGMLLFHKDAFLQLLEGPEREVKSIFRLVSCDHRHRDIKVLLTESTPEREFPGWTMGFERLEEAWSIPRAWATILEDGLNSNSMTGHPSTVKELLLSFRHSVEENS